MTRTVLFCTTIAACVACGGASHREFDPASLDSDSAAPAPDAGAAIGDDSGPVPTIEAGHVDAAADCGDDVQKIYVISVQSDLYRFDPTKVATNAGAFTKIGAVRCAGASGKPFSMAVDRNGVAWVNFDDGSLQKVSTKDASCTGTAFAPSQAPGFKNFGMAFVTKAQGSTEESLFVAAVTGTGVAVVDTTTLRLAPRGSYGTLASEAELTGTGDARLYAFFGGGLGADASLGAVDPMSGRLSGVKTITGLKVGTDFAYAFWGGTFWLFTNGLDVNNPVLSNGSFVTEYDYAMGVASGRAKDVGFDIVGAGVSTCAPLVKPPPR